MTDGGQLGTCESARGHDADRHVKLPSQFAVEGSTLGRLFTSQPRSFEDEAMARMRLSMGTHVDR
jgi:hypothetical protein